MVRHPDVTFLGKAYPDLATLAPWRRLVRWYQFGEVERRFANIAECQKLMHRAGIEEFSLEQYLDSNPDLAELIKSKEHAWVHFLSSGMREGRSYGGTSDSKTRLLDDPTEHVGLKSQGFNRVGFAEMGIAAADLYLLGRYLPSRTLGLEGFAAVYESPEFADVWEPWANLDNQLFLINVFMTIAHRLPDAQEFEGLVRELDFNQVTRLRVVRLLMNEHATRKVLTWGAEHREGPEVSGNPSQDSERCGETSFPIVHSFTLLGSRKLVTASEWRAEIFSRDKRLQTEVELAMLRLRSKQSSCALTYEKKDGSTSSPKVSVLVSVYNGANYIDAFAKALIRQTIFPETEVIVLDADSTDDSVAKLQHAFGEWPNVKLNQLSSKLSVYEAWNIGAKIATAPYLTNWNLDDTRHPCSLEVQADYLNRNQSIDVCYQDVWVYFDPNLDFEEIQRHCLLDIVPPISPRTLLSSNYVHNAPMWRRGLHDSLGYFDTNYISAADWEFWLRCATRGVQFGKCPIPTVAYYVNPVGVSTRPGTAGITESSSIRDRYRAALRYPDVECDYSFLPFGRYPSRSERIAATFMTRLMRA